jgi:hypothetical protein
LHGYSPNEDLNEKFWNINKMISPPYSAYEWINKTVRINGSMGRSSYFSNN